jgi:hypothetical protein
LKRFLRQALPWLVGVAILVAIFARISFAEVREALGKGAYMPVALLMVAFTAVWLFTDAFATWVGLIALRMRRPFGKVVAVRGATFLLMVLNYTVSQGGFGYYLHRSGERPLRATGATLFLLGINLAVLLVITSCVWLVARDDVPPAVGWILLAGLAGFAVYLVVIALAPPVLVARDVLAPLFEAGVRGHAWALLARVPHIAAVVVGTWLTMRAWGIAVPFWAGVTLMPIWLVVSALPVSPGGLGTGQAAMLYLFRDYASESSVLAYSIVYFAFATLVSVVFGGVCAAIARKLPDQPP